MKFLLTEVNYTEFSLELQSRALGAACPWQINYVGNIKDKTDGELLVSFPS